MTKMFLLGCLVFLSIPAWLGAFDGQDLSQNGAVFVQGEEPVELHGLEVPGLLDLSPGQQETLMDRAALAGFNSIVFNAPGGSLPHNVAGLAETLHRMNVRLLYAFPILWNAEGFRRLQGSTPTAGAWSDPGLLERETSCLGALSALTRESDGGRADSSLGGWVLWDGALPADLKAFEAWTALQAEVLRKAGLRQVKGLRLRFNDAQGPGKLRRLITRLPLDTQAGFVLMQADGSVEQVAALGEWAAKDFEIPLALGLDWRALPAARRQELLATPGLAGVEGFWPTSAWPRPDKPLWAPEPLDHGKPAKAALILKELQVSVDNGQVELSYISNRPCVATVHYGRDVEMSERARDEKPVLIHQIRLPGVKSGDKLAVQIRSKTEKWGRAVYPTTWVEVP